jgi:two-component SAPR family response regulator
MLTTLLVSKKYVSFSDFVSTLEQEYNNKVLSTDSGKKALQLIKEQPFDMVIVDEELSDVTGLHFINKLVKVNPLINCAAVSSLPEEDFHEESEGLGVLMQLPVKPQKKDAEVLMQKFKKIKSLMVS